LSGSVVSGGATETSDLDVTVLLATGPAHRESVVWAGWPIELFVHTEESVRTFVAKDVKKRRPTMARLVATGVPLLDGHGGLELQQESQPLSLQALDHFNRMRWHSRATC